MPLITHSHGVTPERDFERVLSLRVHPKIKTIEDYSEALVEGVKDFEKVFRNEVGELSADMISEGHFLVFGGVHPWAGKWRTEYVEVGGFDALNPGQIEEALKRLHDRQVEAIVKEPTQEERCAMMGEFHCRFENIHPFMDGNGRLGRLLLDHQMNVAFGPKLWPSLDFKEYANALKAGNQQDYLIMGGLVDTLVKTGISYEQMHERMAASLEQLEQQKQKQVLKPTLGL